MTPIEDFFRILGNLLRVLNSFYSGPIYMSTVLLVKSLALVILHLCIMVISDFIYRFKQVTLLALWPLSHWKLSPSLRQTKLSTVLTLLKRWSFCFQQKCLLTLEFYAAQPTSLYHTILNVFQEHLQVENFLKPMV